MSETKTDGQTRIERKCLMLSYFFFLTHFQGKCISFLKRTKIRDLRDVIHRNRAIVGFHSNFSLSASIFKLQLLRL